MTHPNTKGFIGAVKSGSLYLLMALGLGVCVVAPLMLSTKVRLERQRTQELASLRIEACAKALQTAEQAHSKLVEMIRSDEQLEISATANALALTKMLTKARTSMSPSQWTAFKAQVTPKIEDGQQMARSANLGVRMFTKDIDSVDARTVEVRRLCDQADSN